MDARAPYVYSDDPRLRAYAEHEGKDSHLSFFSAHASNTFAASVAGSYLFAQASTDKSARAGVWGVELALAAATARLRTRAGKHFYSDVIVGAIVGVGVGYLTPRLHGGPAYRPSAAEWVVIGTAPLAGLALAQLLPGQADHHGAAHGDRAPLHHAGRWRNDARAGVLASAMPLYSRAVIPCSYRRSSSMSG